MAQRNRNIHKRMNWFDRQFLRAQDFVDEQDFFLTRLRINNKILHSPGVAVGLTVNGASGATAVTVEPGVAFDLKGREIILLGQQTLPVPNGATEIQVYALCVESETDPSADPGVVGNTRITEAANIVIIRSGVTSGTPDPIPTDADGAQAILLATAGVAGGALTGPPTNAPHTALNVESIHANQVDANSLNAHHIRADDIGVGIASPARPLHVLNPGTVSARFETTNTASASVEFKSGAATWEHSVAGPAGANVGGGTVPAGSLYIRQGASAPALTVDTNNNVGVGTRTPQGRLDVNSGATPRDALFVRADPAAANQGGIIHHQGAANAWQEVAQNTGAGDGILAFHYVTLAHPETKTRANVLTLRANGSVGVGTAAPARPLHITDAGTVSARFETTNTASASVEFKSGAATWEYSVAGSAGTNVGGIPVPAGSLYVLRQGAPAPALTVDANNNVGVGTASPATKLHVQQGGGPGLSVLSGSNTAGQHTAIQIGRQAADGSLAVASKTGEWAPSAAAGDIVLRTETTGTKLILNNSGVGGPGLVLNNNNVGIGTTSPGEKLHVGGGNLWSDSNNAMLMLGPNREVSLQRDPRGGADNSGWLESNAFLDGAGGWRLRNTGVGAALVGIRPNAFDVWTSPSGTSPNWTQQFSVTNITSFFAGNVGIGIGTPAAGQRLHVLGNARIDGILTATKLGYVIDKFINNLGDTLEEGDVVVIGDNQATGRYGVNDNIPIPEVDLAQTANDTRVCGVVCQVADDEGDEADAATSEGGHDGGNKKSGRKSGKKQSAKVSKRAGKAEAAAPPRKGASEEGGADITKVAPGQSGYMVTLGAFAHCKVDADIAPIKVGDLLTTSPTRGHAQKVQEPDKALGAIIGKALGALKKGKGKIPVLVTLH